MDNFKFLHDKVIKALDLANTVIIGKEDKLKLSLCCFLSNGHLLIEDVPGVGKTSLVKLFAKLLGLETNVFNLQTILYPLIF